MNLMQSGGNVFSPFWPSAMRGFLVTLRSTLMVCVSYGSGTHHGCAARLDCGVLLPLNIVANVKVW